MGLSQARGRVSAGQPMRADLVWLSLGLQDFSVMDALGAHKSAPPAHTVLGGRFRRSRCGCPRSIWMHGDNTEVTRNERWSLFGVGNANAGCAVVTQQVIGQSSSSQGAVGSGWSSSVCSDDNEQHRSMGWAWSTFVAKVSWSVQQQSRSDNPNPLSGRATRALTSRMTTKSRMRVVYTLIAQMRIKKSPGTGDLPSCEFPRKGSSCLWVARFGQMLHDF